MFENRFNNVENEYREEVETNEVVQEKKAKKPSKSRKQVLKERMEKARQRKAEEEEKLRKLIEEKKRKAREEEEAMLKALKELEEKENPILGKWVREAYEEEFSHEAIERLKEKAIKLIEDGIKA